MDDSIKQSDVRTAKRWLPLFQAHFRRITCCFARERRCDKVDTHPESRRLAAEVELHRPIQFMRQLITHVKLLLPSDRIPT